MRGSYFRRRQSNTADAPVFCIVDPCLNGFVGHHYEYDRSTAAAATRQGYRPLILSHRSVVGEIAAEESVRPTFTLDIWASTPGLQHSPQENLLFCNRVFYRDLLEGTADVPLGPETVVFGHMITARQLLGWAWFANKYVRRNGLVLVLLLRYQPEFYHGELCERAFRMLERAARRGKVRLVSDSARLAEEIEKLTDLPVEEVAIPHTTDLGVFSDENAPPITPSRLRVVSLGNARDEKGFLEILESIRILHETGRNTAFEFVLQANDAQPDVQAAIDGFAALKVPGVTLISEALNSEDYYETLLSADLVLLPYWHSIYEARTSGVFLEAVAAGKPVVCTDDTWMSDQLQLAGAAVLCRDRDAHDLARAIVEARENYELLIEQARRTRPDYLARHNAERLVKELTGSAPLRSSSRLPRIAVLYPWGDALSGQAGASLRLNLLLRFLEQNGADVRVLQSGTEEGKLHPYVRVEAYDTEPPARRLARERFERLCGWLGMSAKGAHHFWWHLAPKRDAELRRRIRGVIRWADVVMLEYTFWGALVAPICRELGKRYVLTDYDIVADQVEAPLLRMLTERLEFSTLKKADHAVSVACDDQRRMTAGGVSSSLIPNPVDTAVWELKLPVDTVAILDSMYGLPLGSAQVCLFVGSGFEPNRIAAERIRVMAREVQSRVPGSNIIFIIAGGCAAPAREGNFWALGRVDDFLLHALYEQACLVLIPLPFGTGASLKTVEAFAAGKAVLGTEVAFRELNVSSGTECLVEPNMSTYPDLILDLLAKPSRRNALGAAAQSFAKGFDYRQVFKRYIPLLGVPLTEPVPAPDALPDPAAIFAGDTARLLARRAVQQKQWDHGKTFASLALNVDARDPEMNFLMGEVLAAEESAQSAALKHYETAQQHGYSRFPVQVARSKLLRRGGQSSRAEAEEMQAIRTQIEASRFDPQLGKLRKIGWELFERNELDLLAMLCRETHSALPNHQHGDTHYLLGLSLQSLGQDLEEALLHYNRALELGFDEFWVRMHRARLRQTLADDAGAEADLLRATALKPQDPDAARTLAAARVTPLWRDFNAKDHAAVLARGRALLQQHESGEVHYLLAQSFRALERDPVEALRHYGRALELGFDEFWVRLHRGQLRQALGDDAGSEADFDRAAALKPDDLNAIQALSSARLAPLWRHFHAQNYVAVLAAGRALLQRHETGEVHYLLAQSLQALKRDLDGALRHYGRALELGFDEFWVRIHRGQLRQALGDDAGSEADLDRAAALKPDDLNAIQALSSARLAPLWRHFHAQNYVAVLAAGRALLQRHETGEVHYLLAQSLHSAELELDRALLHYDRALELGFDEFWVRTHRARLKQTLGDFASAEGDLERAAALNPDDPDAVQDVGFGAGGTAVARVQC